jgi:dimethylglycine dehydrogenase
MAEFDPRRFGKFASQTYVRDKVFQDYRLTFTTRKPGDEEMAGRPQKKGPLYDRLAAQGCVYTETFGWERPKWFSLDGRIEDYSYARNNIFDVVRDEVAAVHERVGILDLTGFAKYDISGPHAETFLNRICANQIPRKVGGIALVHLLSAGARILGEMTVSRLADDRFYALSATAAELRDADLLTQSVQPSETVRIENVTEDRGVLVLSGPRSRELLSLLTDADLSNEQFRWLAAREISVAGHPLRALRVSYVGELGWELHAPMASLAALYDAIWMQGQGFGIANYGLYALNSMRIEKAYKAWSAELTNELNMLEADMSRFVNFKKEEFVGKAALLSQAPRPFKIAYAELAATDSDARGGEPVLDGDRCIGVTTSGAYGHRVKKSLLFACVEPQFAVPGSHFEVLVQGARRRATVLARAAYDADNLRMRV